MAINVLSQYGLFYKFQGDRGVCIKANFQKLLSLVFYITEKNFDKIEGQLNQAKSKFKQLEVYQG